MFVIQMYLSAIQTKILKYNKRQNKLHFKFSNQLIYRTCLGSWFLVLMSFIINAL
jgi:hypothetical protein